MLRLLQDPDQDGRIAAAGGLRTIGGESDIVGLLNLLEHSDASIRQFAIDVSGDIGARSAAPELLKRLQDPIDDIRAKAAYTLGLVGDENVIPELLALLEQAVSLRVHESVIDALGNIRHRNTIPGLITFLQNSNGSIREKTIFALGRIGDESVISDLLTLLQSSTLETVQEAAFLLGEMSAEIAIPALLQILGSSKSWRTRLFVGEALSKFKNDRAAHILPQLPQFLSTQSGEDAFNAILAIQANCQFYNYEIFQAHLAA